MKNLVNPDGATCLLFFRARLGALAGFIVALVIASCL